MKHAPPASPVPISEISLLRAIDAALGCGVAAVDTAKTQIHVNDAFCAMVGWSREELVGAKPPFVYWPEEEHERIRGVLRAILAGQLPRVGAEIVLRRRNGERFPAHMQVAPLRDGGETSGWVASVIDLSHERDQARALRLSNERLEAAQEGGHVGVWDWSMQTNESYWSRETARIYGMPPDAVFDYQAWRRRVSPEDLPRIDAIVDEKTARREPFEIEFRIRLDDGETRWILAKGKAQYGADGRPIRVLGINLDITDRKNSEESLRALTGSLEAQVSERTAQLSAAVAAKSEFLAHMSHEIRTPMNAVLGLTQLLLRERLTAEQSELVRTIDESGQSLLRIINDILDFSKIEAGQLQFERQPYDPGAVLTRLDVLFRDMAGKRGITLAIAPPPPGLGMIVGDAVRLEQVLVNLLNNAIKFTPRGKVELRVTATHATDTTGSLRFEVQDTGIGIAATAMPTLFDPFFQVGSEISRQYGGTGLGLPICKRLVELMGGRIGVESQPGEGSTFWFEIPFTCDGEAAATAARPATPAIAEPALVGLRVLAADDNRVNLLILEKCLRKEGATVTFAADGQQALQILRAQPQGFDLVLMDLRMPVMDGLAATRAIRADPELASIPVLALTAGVMPEERTRALAAGVDDFLTKPIDLEQMIRMLAAIRVERHRIY